MNGDGMSSRTDKNPGNGPVLGGRYQLISQIGVGGMAVVWQAYDTVLARTVAVKVLAGHSADDPQSRERIRAEAQAAAVLSHPNIAQVYDYGEAESGGALIPYVVMELVRGGTLQRRLSEGPVLPRYAMRLSAEIAAALAAAHAEGLAHRDIKPGNVMLAPTGAKVVDFGIAAAIRPPGSGTDDFEVFGTPAYLAPERLLHDAVEPASDVYALGVLLYRLLAGHSPWTSETTTQMLTAHIYLEPAPLEQMPQVPPYVTALCNRCLAKDPTERPSAREAAALLAHAAGLQVVTDEPPAQPAAIVDTEPSVLIRALGSPPPPPPPADAEPAAVPSPPAGDDPGSARRIRPVLAVVAVVLLMAVAVSVWLLRPTDETAAESAPRFGSTGAPAPSRGATDPPPGPSPAPATTAPGDPAAGPTATTTTTAGQQPANAISPGDPAAPPPPPPSPGATPRTPAPEPTATTTTPPAEPVERTLSSSAGSVRATCPEAGTAQILSWTATKPYKVTQGDKDPGPSPAVSFKHGNKQVTMTVTCSGGVPSAS
jgi:serine/threonine protein kinase